MDNLTTSLRFPNIAGLVSLSTPLIPLLSGLKACRGLNRRQHPACSSAIRSNRRSGDLVFSCENQRLGWKQWLRKSLPTWSTCASSVNTINKRTPSMCQGPSGCSKAPFRYPFRSYDRLHMAYRGGQSNHGRSSRWNARRRLWRPCSV